MNKVWVLHSGCIYEGGGLDGLYKNYEDARTAALEKVKKENAWRDDANNEPSNVDDFGIPEFDYNFSLYEEKEENRWTTEVDYIEIFEQEIL